MDAEEYLKACKLDVLDSQVYPNVPLTDALEAVRLARKKGFESKFEVKALYVKAKRETTKEMKKFAENIIIKCPNEHHRDDYYWGWNDAGIEMQKELKRFLEVKK